MSLTGHFISEDWSRKQVVLNVKPMTGSQTDSYLQETFLNMLGDWDIATEHVVLVLRDGGANMVKGMKLADLPDLSCTSHILQLIINDGLSCPSCPGHYCHIKKLCNSLWPLCTGQTEAKNHSGGARSPKAQHHPGRPNSMELNTLHAPNVCMNRVNMAISAAYLVHSGTLSVTLLTHWFPSK